MTAAALERLRAAPTRLEASRFARLAHALDLDAFERGLVALCFAVETDEDAARALAELAGHAAAPGVPVWLAHRALDAEHWAATSSAGALRRWRVLDVAAAAPRLEQRLRLAEPVVDALLGLNAPAARWRECLVPLPRVAAADRSQCDALAAALLPGADGLAPVLVLPSREALEVAAALAAAWSLVAQRLDVARLAAERVSVEELQRTFERDTLFAPTLLIAETPADPAQAEFLGRFLEGLAAYVVVLGDPPPGLARAIVRHTPVAVPGGSLARWRDALGDAVSARLNGSVERVAAQFTLPSQRIAQVATTARRVIEALDDEHAAADALWRAGRDAARPEPGPLARVVDPVATLADLVVPDEVRADLDAIVRHVRHGATVYERWGFATVGARGRGLTALFSGPSGTGKTLAAEALAHALSLPLVIADFSQLQSKWVGETAKHVARLFDELDRGGAVLLLDEADGLLGRRGAVIEAHDRHSNADVAYFLQRLETFRGLAILTTNMKSSLDEAFLRRYRFVIDFPLPDVGDRRRLWRRAFPAAAPRGALDVEALARLPLAGGAIRNVALNAAFAAADEGVAIESRHVRAALQAEYRKLERPLAELIGSLDT